MGSGEFEIRFLNFKQPLTRNLKNEVRFTKLKIRFWEQGISNTEYRIAKLNYFYNETRNPQTRNPQTRNPKPANPKPENPKPKTRNTKPENPKPETRLSAVAQRRRKTRNKKCQNYLKVVPLVKTYFTWVNWPVRTVRQKFRGIFHCQNWCNCPEKNRDLCWILLKRGEA